MSANCKAANIPDRRTRYQIAARAGVDERTIYRHLKGETRRSHPLIAEAVREACRAFGYEVQS